jgi:hypothetical protein
VTEKRAHLLLLAAGLVLTTVGVLGLSALGVQGMVLSLGFLVPMALVGLGIGWVVVHFEEPEHDGSHRSNS